MLYLVRGHEVEGENQDVFVVALDPDEAITLWNEWCLDSGLPRVEEDDEDPKTIERPKNVREIIPVKGSRYDTGKSAWIEWPDLVIVA